MVNIDEKLVATYVEMLSRLNDASKLEIISRLSRSMQKEKKQEEDDSISELYGAFEGKESADELIESIRNARMPNRNV